MCHASSVSVHGWGICDPCTCLKPLLSENNLDLTVSLTVACAVLHKFPNGTPAVVFSVLLRNRDTMSFGFTLFIIAENSKENKPENCREKRMMLCKEIKCHTVTVWFVPHCEIS